MLNNFVVKLAFRYFSAKKSNRFVSFVSTFSLLGVMIGVAALIVVMAVMEGFHIELTSNIIGLSGDISVSKPAMQSFSGYKDITDKISKIDGIRKVIPQINEKAFAISKKNSSGVIIKAMNPSDIVFKDRIIQNQIRGDIADLSNNFHVALGVGLASNLGVKAGDEISVILPNSLTSMIGELPRKKTLKVASVFSSGLYDYDAATILMSLTTAQKIYSYPSKVNYIEIYTNDKDNSIKFYDDIYAASGDDFIAQSWIETNYQFLNALKTERVAMFTILTLIILVAAFNIVSSLFMLVKEKTKDIAILKTIGASKNQILMIFILNGFIIGFIGTVLGVVIGVVFANNIEKIRKLLESFTGTNIFDSAIYFLDHLPSVIQWSNVISISFMSLFLCLIATIYPAYKASSLDPVEAIRNE
jgi:lipoprotein-releasing system permease protein